MTGPTDHNTEVSSTVSAAIVCKDAARTIERTIDSLQGWTRSVVAIDSGSTDGTLEFLRRRGVRVIEHEWLGHVRTKQMALSEAAGLEGTAWVLSLDADESVGAELRSAVLELVARDDAETVGARVNRKIWYRGRFLEHAWQPERRLRLVRADAARRGTVRWGGLDPHDALRADRDAGRVVDLAGTLRHDSFELFADQLAKDTAYARMMAQNLHDSGVRGKRLRCVTSPIGAFAKQMVVKRAWRDGAAGWLAALATASATLQKHAMLLELDELDRESGGVERGGKAGES
ncbi:MAG: glycosyltransferase family 2 protein [Planctomycetota bacterium]